MKRRLLFRAAPTELGRIDLLAQVYKQVSPNGVFNPTAALVGFAHSFDVIALRFFLLEC
jgi:hypothetical protein